MKTLTEFDGFTLKNALNTKKELVGAGKTEEEVSQAIAEAFKLEGDRLNCFLKALEVVENKTDHLKRIVVYNVEEGQKAPQGAVQKDDKYFLAEQFFTPQAKRHDKKHDGSRDKKGRGKKKGRRRPPRQAAAAGNKPVAGNQSVAGNKPVVVPNKPVVTPNSQS